MQDTTQTIDYNQITTIISDQINSSFGGLFQYLAVGSVFLTVLVIAVWIFNSFRKWKVEKAILDIRDELREMNSRQKDQTLPSKSQSSISEDNI